MVIDNDRYERENQGENLEQDYITETIKDLLDVQLLQVQSQAQIILAIGYLLEYTASRQAIQVIENRILQRNFDKSTGNYSRNELEKLEDQGKLWQNAGLNSDKTALLAAEFELYGQIILTRLDYVKFQKLPDNLSRRDLTLTKTANIDIYNGAVLELIAYILNYKGALILYEISNEDTTLD